MGQHSPLFARQPIFNRKLEVVAYELLFRSHNQDEIRQWDGDKASSHVIFYAFGEHNIQDVIGRRPAFINFTRNLLVAPPPLPPEQLVIEVLEDVEADDEVLQGLHSLKKAGYKIALDDFFLTKNTELLLPYADLVKIDVLALSDDELENHVHYLRQHEVELLAEKVETYEMLDYCKHQGFDFFQGYFLSRPQTVQGVRLADNKAAVLQLLRKLTDPMADFDDIVQTIATDPILSYKVLKLVNSASSGLRRKIDSLSHAVAMLGLTQIRNWAIFLLLMSNGDKPKELCVLSLTRARFCELLGTRLYGRAVGEMAFTAGLLSNLDAFMDLPMEQLVEKLHFAEQVESALMHQRGKIGEILQIILLHEKGWWEKMDWQFLQQHQLDDTELNEIYTTALSWAKNMLDSQDF